MEELDQYNIEDKVSRFLFGEMEEAEKQEYLSNNNDLSDFKECNDNIAFILSQIEDIKIKDNINTSEALKKIKKDRIFKTPLSVGLYRVMQKVAVILLLAAITYLLYLQFGTDSKTRQNIVYHDDYASSGVRSLVTLGDGSKVWLNSKSHLRYPGVFEDSARIVYLDGEGYFDVATNPDKPFIVVTDKFKVNATGTQFDVMSYESEDLLEITLVEGKVDVVANGSESNQKKDKLLPGQQFVFNKKEGISDIINVDTDKFTSWKDGKLIFRNDSMCEVIRKIERFYDVDIELKGKELYSYRYWATFESETVSDIMRLMKLTAPINYKEIERKKLDDGSFSKRKILITYNPKFNL